MFSRRWWPIGLLVAAFAGGADLSGCSSHALPDGTGGSGGRVSGAGGAFSGMGGSGAGDSGAGGASMGGSGTGGSGMGGASVGGAGTGGSGMGGSGTGGSGTGGSGMGGSGAGGAIDGGVFSPGSCIPNHINPDFAAGGACSSGCQSVSCGLPCTEDCCVPCGIDQLGSKTCACPNPGIAYSSCVCAPPANFPAGLQGGPCSPPGYASTVPPPSAPAGSISLKGLPCRALNLVCFSVESTAMAERGCICMADGVMHCGAVNQWFVNDNIATAWQP